MWQKYKPFFIEVFGILNQGFPSHPCWRGCNAIVPLHLPDALERHQLRMASNGIAMSTFVLSPKHKGALYRPLVVGYNAGRAGGERQQVGGHTTHDARTQH